MTIQKLRACSSLMVNEAKLLVCISTDDLLDGKGYFKVNPEQIDILTKLLETQQLFDAIVEMTKGETSRLKTII